MKISSIFLNRKSLILILLIAAVLRLWMLGSIPPGLTPDEAALGYNAYSILKTGRDEYGEILPIIFKSFGDYKPGLYVYLTVPFVATLGLNEFSVRLPSALAGIISVYLIYLIVELLHKNRKLSLVSAFVAAVTPWLVYFSRGAWEANVALTLTLGGIFFFLKALKKNKYVVLSALLFALTLLTYQGAKLATGIVVIILATVYWKNLFKIEKRYLAASFLLGIFISFPIIISSFIGQTGRLRVFSLFSYPRTKENVETFLNQGSEKIGDTNYYLFHSETLNFARGILGRWFNHFSGRFLFFEGDYSNPRHSAPYQGMFLLSDLILLIVGFAVLVRKGLTKETAFIWLWLILAPLPAILSRNQVHAIRAMNMVLPMVVILSFGLNEILKNRFTRVLFSGIFILSFIYFLDAYFVHVPKHDSKLWEYGYKQIVETIIPIQKKYDKIKIQQSFSQPYIYFLFFQKYDPSKYQDQANLVESEYKYDVGYVTKLDNIEFIPIDWPINRGEHGTLFAGDTIRIPPDDSADTKLFQLIKEIKYLDGNTAFRILEVK